MLEGIIINIVVVVNMNSVVVNMSKAAIVYVDIVDRLSHTPVTVTGVPRVSTLIVYAIVLNNKLAIMGWGRSVFMGWGRCNTSHH